MKKFLHDIAAGPHCSEALHYDAAAKVLTGEKTGNRYAVENGVPVLLPAAPAQAVADSRLHDELGMAFDYAGHYQKVAAFGIQNLHANGLSCMLCPSLVRSGWQAVCRTEYPIATFHGRTCFFFFQP
jgi:uncharacterized protein YbaR (Trm112 family)